MAQTNLDRAHYTELVTGSNIDRSLINLNFESLQGNSAYDRLFISSQIPRINSGKVSPSWMRRYYHCANGGWWCNGLYPLNNWQQME